MDKHNSLYMPVLCIALMELLKKHAETAGKNLMISRVSRKLVGRLGNQMVGWGTKLQRYDVISQNSNLKQDVQSHRLKHL
jgi:hypothetical protein